MPDKTIPGTNITETSMEKMLRHNREIVGVGKDPKTEIDHQRIAEQLNNGPVLLPVIAAPRVRATKVVERALQAEGVDGTSPTPGQDDISYIPPTTSNTADPGDPGISPSSGELEPATKGKGQSRMEKLVADIETLFAESGDGDNNDKGDKDDKDGDGKDKDGKDKDGKKDDEEDVDEAVEVHCNECGYEETYDLSETSIAEGSVPLTPDGQFDPKCPMCGAAMDMSLIGATNTPEVTNPQPFTDPRGNSPQRTVPQESLEYAANLMHQVVEGVDVDLLANQVIQGDFIPRHA